MPSYVTFEETGERLYIRHACIVCVRGSFSRFDAMWRNPKIVSPTGFVHEPGETNETTWCGRDATKDGWWHRL